MSKESFLKSLETSKSPEDFFRQNPAATDFDGIFCDLRTHAINEFNKRFGTKYSTFDIRHFGQVIEWSKEQHLSEQDSLILEEELWYDPEFISKAELVSGSLRFFKWFVDNKISIPVITTRRPELHEVTTEWLKSKVPWFPSDQIYLRPESMSNKMPGDIFKAFMIDKLGIGIFFEDTLEQAETILKYTDALVVLQSNVHTIDGLYPKQLIRIPETQGIGPDMNPIYELFINRNLNVAQC